MSEAAVENEAPVENHSCAVCGQLDNHPMIHVMGPWQKQTDEGRLIIDDPSFHFDCLPEEFESLMGNEPQHAVTLAGIEAARDGVHGDDLREFLLAQPSDNDIETEES